MEVILVKNVEKLGYTDDVVNVKPGFALNYLIPQGFAVVNNPTNQKLLAGRQRGHEMRAAKMLSQINEISECLRNAVLKIGAKTGTTDKIFGSVSPFHVAEAIKAACQVEVDRRKVTIIEGEVKTLGTYTAEVNLGKDHKVNVSFEVVAE